MKHEDILPFVLGGNSIFTLYSKKINKRYTYKIQKDKKSNTRYKVKVLFGPDNGNDYRYIGLFHVCINRDDRFTNVFEYTVFPLVKTTNNLSCKMLTYFLKYANNELEWPDTCEFYPSGRCGRCGRLLTTPESIESGFGPKCSLKRGV